MNEIKWRHHATFTCSCGDECKLFPSCDNDIELVDLEEPIGFFSKAPRSLRNGFDGNFNGTGHAEE